MLMDYLTYVNDLDIDDSIKLKAKSLYEDFKESSPNIILPELVDIQITGLYPYKSDHTIRVKNEKANIIYGGKEPTIKEINLIITFLLQQYMCT